MSNIMVDDSEDSINDLKETAERTIPPKKARVIDSEDGRCIIFVCNTEKEKVSKFQERSWKAALNAARIRRDTLLENQELIELPDER